MHQQDHQLDMVFHEVDAPVGLYEKVFSYIQRRRQRAARMRVAALGTLALASGALLVPAMQYVAEELYASGFYEFASLALSDRAIFFSAWQELGLSLIESLPSIALLIVFVAAGTLLWSLRRALLQARIGFLALQHN